MKHDYSPETMMAFTTAGAVRVDVAKIALRAGLSETTTRKVLRAMPGPSLRCVTRVLMAAGVTPLDGVSPGDDPLVWRATIDAWFDAHNGINWDLT